MMKTTHLIDLIPTDLTPHRRSRPKRSLLALSASILLFCVSCITSGDNIQTKSKTFRFAFHMAGLDTVYLTATNFTPESTQIAHSSTVSESVIVNAEFKLTGDLDTYAEAFDADTIRVTMRSPDTIDVVVVDHKPMPGGGGLVSDISIEVVKDSSLAVAILN